MQLLQFHPLWTFMRQKKNSTDWKKSKFEIILNAIQIQLGRDTEIYTFYNSYLFIFYTIAPNLLMFGTYSFFLVIFLLILLQKNPKLFFTIHKFLAGKILSALNLKNIVNNILHSLISKYRFIYICICIMHLYIF